MRTTVSTAPTSTCGSIISSRGYGLRLSSFATSAIDPRDVPAIAERAGVEGRDPWGSHHWRRWRWMRAAAANGPRVPPEEVGEARAGRGAPTPTTGVADRTRPPTLA